MTVQVRHKRWWGSDDANTNVGEKCKLWKEWTQGSEDKEKYREAKRKARKAMEHVEIDFQMLLGDSIRVCFNCNEYSQN